MKKGSVDIVSSDPFFYAEKRTKYNMFIINKILNKKYANL